jgi:hypothetical protein
MRDFNFIFSRKIAKTKRNGLRFASRCEITEKKESETGAPLVQHIGSGNIKHQAPLPSSSIFPTHQGRGATEGLPQLPTILTVSTQKNQAAKLLNVQCPTHRRIIS